MSESESRMNEEDKSTFPISCHLTIEWYKPFENKISITCTCIMITATVALEIR